MRRSERFNNHYFDNLKQVDGGYFTKTTRPLESTRGTTF